MKICELEEEDVQDRAKWKVKIWKADSITRWDKRSEADEEESPNNNLENLSVLGQYEGKWLRRRIPERYTYIEVVGGYLIHALHVALGNLYGGKTYFVVVSVRKRRRRRLIDSTDATISCKPVVMARARVLQVILLLTLCLGLQAKVYTRCQLTRELLKNNFSRTFLSNWVCLIEQESDRNTSAMVVKSPRRKFYGLFQIGSEWCKEGKKGGKCDITCEALLDEDIKDDGICAVKVFEQEGFKYWAKWEARCKGQLLPDIEKCPDWVHPPNRASPPRDKRTARGKRSLRKSRKAIFTNPLF
ncbi:hypothetical protein B5X24_HaOG211658 [Helicoverpa armigera]|uniref:Lysozyme n=1 Tax=Helicoverpa armigera TaxID=29058 RepID=A0A2W1BCW3_HELAM|nr:hypothetical protein B5X24_HaOG211658 [Helicoverpa armigera]